LIIKRHLKTRMLSFPRRRESRNNVGAIHELPLLDSASSAE
jgi:hypothetical protein